MLLLNNRFSSYTVHVAPPGRPGALTLAPAAVTSSTLPFPLVVPRGGRRESPCAAGEGDGGDLASRGRGVAAWRGCARRHEIYLRRLLLLAARRRSGDYVGTADSAGVVTDLLRKGPGAAAPDKAAAASPPPGMTGQEAASCGCAWGRRIKGSRTRVRRWRRVAAGAFSGVYGA